MFLIAEAAKYDCFYPPDPKQMIISPALDTPKFHPAVTRLFELGLIWTNTVPQQGIYAFHWTCKGKKVLELLGQRAKPAPAQA
jgi:hypothetical protein